VHPLQPGSIPVWPPLVPCLSLSTSSRTAKETRRRGKHLIWAQGPFFSRGSPPRFTWALKLSRNPTSLLLPLPLPPLVWLGRMIRSCAGHVQYLQCTAQDMAKQTASLIAGHATDARLPIVPLQVVVWLRLVVSGWACYEVLALLQVKNKRRGA
jgi:hypothetical protein